MDMLDTVYVGHTICPVHGHNIFGMVVSDEIEVAEFSLDGIFRSKQVCNLHIDSSILILSNEIYFGFLQLPHIDGVTQTGEMFVDDILHNLLNIELPVPADDGVPYA